ncbi:MAG: VOC family protein [Chloroflexi bacterium]|nr:VOC family protein [Chloroflexota bacterium]
MLAKVHSVLIWTEDLHRLVPFYRDVLGLKPQMEAEGFVVFGSEGAQVVIGVHSEVHGRSRDPNRIMVNFAVEDCQAVYERLKGQGVEFIRPPSKEDGITIATLRDPDGNVLQLFQEG